MRVLLDTNVLLDYYLSREPFFQDAVELVNAHQKGKFVGYVAGITVINLYYVARKIKGDSDARTSVHLLLSTFEVIPINHSLLAAALVLPIKDYEDGVQVASAALLKLDAVVTRDSKDFKNSHLPVYQPTDFLKLL